MANLDAIKTSSKVLPAGQIVTHSTFSDTFPPAMRRQQRPIVLQMLQITAVKLPSHFLLFWDLLQWSGYWPPTKKGENSPFRSADTPATDKKGTIVFAPPQWAVNLLQCPRHSPITSTRLKSSSATGKKDCLLMSLMFYSIIHLSCIVAGNIILNDCDNHDERLWWWDMSNFGREFKSKLWLQ